MKVVHIISSIDISTGGPARSVTHLIEKLINNNIDITLITGQTENPIIEKFKNSLGKIVFLRYKEFFKLNNYKSTFKDASLFHGHGLWQIPVNRMAKLARVTNTPYIITPRGMLEPWSLGQGKIKKKIALSLFQKNDIRKASCIHVTGEMERQNIRNLGFKNPIAIIPNGVNIDSFPIEEPTKSGKQKNFLFLSRIHQKKGIENLIEAWSQIEKKYKENWIIEIVGNGEASYIESLNKKILGKQLKSQIFIKPPVFGSNKIQLFREASLFVLPTFSENFGIVVAEALASFTPVITTKGAPWEDLETHNCGWWIDIGVQPLKEVLEKAMQTSESDLLQISKNGRQLIEDKYSIESVAKQMLQLYDWILNKGEKPNFVSLA